MTNPTPDDVLADRIEFTRIENRSQFPAWTNYDALALFFHETMKPYHDQLEDVKRAIHYAFSDRVGEGGFLALAHAGPKLYGALLMLNTGMKGYIPENILLFVTVTPEARGLGVGRKLIEWSISECDGNVKLHVEYDNPAKRLYERIGFTTRYAEMRFIK